MNNYNQINNEEQLLKALEEFLCDVAEDEPIENIENDLRNLGFDPISLGEKGKNISRLGLANSPLNWRNTGKKEIEITKEKLKQVNIPEGKALNRTSIINKIQKLISSTTSNNLNLASAHFRNFETASDSDLLSMLTELEFLISGHEHKDTD